MERVAHHQFKPDWRSASPSISRRSGFVKLPPRYELIVKFRLQIEDAPRSKFGLVELTASRQSRRPQYPGYAEPWVSLRCHASRARSFVETTREAAHLHVPEIAFIVGWAIVIIAVGAWAARTNRRWVVTTAAVFGAIEFYTQWFERLGAEPWAIIVAGLTIVACAIALWRYNLTGPGPATVTA